MAKRRLEVHGSGAEGRGGANAPEGAGKRPGGAAYGQEGAHGPSGQDGRGAPSAAAGAPTDRPRGRTAETGGQVRRPGYRERAAEAMRSSFEYLQRRWGLALGFAINVFAVIVGCLLLISLIGTTALFFGFVTVDFLTNPAFLIFLALLISFMVTYAVFTIANSLILRPLGSMVEAQVELGRGNFDVRVEAGEGVHIAEIDQFVESFNAAAKELQSVEVLRRGFVDDFSHEFKTPIVSINGFAELLLDDATTDEERREYAGIIARESKRLATMASDILALRQAESLERLTDAEPVNVGEQVRRAAIVAQEKWAGKHLAVDVDVQDASYMGSEALLGHVWMNLLDNACKFSPDGGRVGVRVWTEADAAAADTVPGATTRAAPGATTRTTGGVAAARAAAPSAADGIAAGTARIVATVENDGPALPPDALGHVFERFYQADASHATQGCGLGLPLAKRVAELHGGSIEAASTPQGHTTFTVALPGIA